MTPDAPLITVLTPTYNRAHLLPRAYESLRSQTLQDFEWLVIDDGSTDDTQRVVTSLVDAASFPVTYVRQDNAGKAAAYNAGLQLATGTFLAVLDSDDALLPSALQTLHEAWCEIPDAERGEFIGVAGLTTDEAGIVRGDRLPQPVLDSDAMQIRFVHHVRGDKWSLNRTDVSKAHPFPVRPGSRFVSEDLLWFEIAKRFRTRFIDVPVLTMAVNDGGEHLSHLSPAVVQGRQDLHRFILTQIPWLPRRSPLHLARSAVAYGRYGYDLGQTAQELMSAIPGLAARAAVLAGLPVAKALSSRDRRSGIVG